MGDKPMDASGHSAKPLIDGMMPRTDQALAAADALDSAARNGVAALVVKDGRPSGALIEQHQTAVHGLAWVATYVTGLRQMRGWGERLNAEDRFGELEQLMVQAAYGEYLNQLSGGIAISQLEFVRPADVVCSAAKRTRGILAAAWRSVAT